MSDMRPFVSFENSAEWVASQSFKSATHQDSADCFWRDCTQLVQSLVENLQSQGMELEARLTASLARETLLEAEVERLRTERRDA